MSQPTGSTTLPRDFQYSYSEINRYRTPEPSSSSQDVAPPSPPQPYRRKIKKRNVPNLSAPTEHFLASVAAADVALPTIEVPDMDEDAIMLDPVTDLDPGFLSPQPSDVLAKTPPRTPDPRTQPNYDVFGSERPDWYTINSPVEEFSRPESAQSDISEHSSDTYFDSIRTSRPSDEGSCATSPDSDATDSFQFPRVSKKPDARHLLSPMGDGASTGLVLNAKIHSKTRNDAAWTKEMTDHLWSVYQIYLQDPTVTPFRIAANAVPPEGVCHRVSREARRSWRGGRYADNRSVPRSTFDISHIDAVIGSSKTASTSRTSSSITPTALPSPKSYIQWPHSGAATRHRLRELCKSKDAYSVQRHHHLQSRSPTPFTKSRLRRRTDVYTPESAKPATFPKDFSLSLTTSTSESMQPDGPLAKLTQDGEVEVAHPSAAISTEDQSSSNDLGLNIDTLPRRLGSPFMAYTYGPSSSKSMEHVRPSLPHTHRQTSSSVSSLRSPLRFDIGSWNTTAPKRRAQNPPDDTCSFVRSSYRSSIHDRVFGPALHDDQRRVRSRGFSMGDEGLGTNSHLPGLFVPAESAPEPQRPSTGVSAPEEDPFITPTNPTLLPSATFDYPRRSAVPAENEAGLRATFPRRLFQHNEPINAVKHRGFATSHFPRHSIDSIDFTREVAPPLQTRLSHLDERLAEIREREASRKRSRE